MHDNFGPVLRKHRADAGLSVRSLARTIGVSATYLSKVERGLCKPLTEDRIKHVSRVLDLDPLEMCRIGGRIPSEVREIFFTP